MVSQPVEELITKPVSQLVNLSVAKFLSYLVGQLLMHFVIIIGQFVSIYMLFSQSYCQLVNFLEVKLLKN